MQPFLIKALLVGFGELNCQHLSLQDSHTPGLVGEYTGCQSRAQVMTVRNMTLIQLGLQPFFCWCQSRQNDAMRRKRALRLALQRENERDRENAAPRRDRDNSGRRCNTVESRASVRRQVFFFEVQARLYSNFRRKECQLHQSPFLKIPPTCQLSRRKLGEEPCIVGQEKSESGKRRDDKR